MNIVGFSGLHHSLPFKQRVWPHLTSRQYRIAQGFDSAAALLSNDTIQAAAAEERFSREKATGAFPVGAIEYCLARGGLSTRGKKRGARRIGVLEKRCCSRIPAACCPVSVATAPVSISFSSR